MMLNFRNWIRWAWVQDRAR